MLHIKLLRSFLASIQINMCPYNKHVCHYHLLALLATASGYFLRHVWVTINTLLPESQPSREFLCATRWGKQHRHRGGSGRNLLLPPVKNRTILQHSFIYYLSYKQRQSGWPNLTQLWNLGNVTNTVRWTMFAAVWEPECVFRLQIVLLSDWITFML